jgi:hypothetical protein
MTGSMIFLGNGISAEAAEAPAETDLPQNDAHDSAAETKAEAAELISTPSEPSTSESQVTQTSDATVTTTTNTYVEETPSAIAATEETVKETVASPDALTKDTTNVTVTVTEDGNTTTTTGNYNEDVYTKETSSTTIVTTSDDALAKELESQINDKEKENTDDNGIKLGEVSEKYFVTDKNEKPVNITDKAAELKEEMKTDDIEDAKFIVETKDGQSKVSYQINDEPVSLSASVSEIILQAKQNDKYEKTTYSIGSKEITDERLKNILDQYTLGRYTDFSIAPATSNGVKITFEDANGNICEVTNEELINLILENAKDSEITTSTENYKGKQEYESEEAAKQEMDKALADGFTNVKTSEGTTTHTVSYKDPREYRSLQDAIDAGDKLKEIKNGGYTDIIIDDKGSTSSSSTVTKDFDGFSVTSKAEYERISHLNTIVVDGETLYVEIDPKDETKTYYYKLDKIEKSFTILAKEGIMDQHQEDCYIIGDKYYYYNSNNGRESSDQYGVDFNTYEAEMNKKLAVQQTPDNTLSWYTKGDYYDGENKIAITKGGTYYVDASVRGRLYLATSEEVTVILYNKSNNTVFVPTATTKYTYEINQTDTINDKKPDFGDTIPNLTFVTNAENVTLPSNNNLGNILATGSNVNIEGGNFSGTIICNKISGWGEGHINPNGSTGYLVDTRTKTTITTSSSKYFVSASKKVKNLIVTGVKELKTIIQSASIEKSEYTRAIATIDKVITVKFSQYSKESKGGTWTETKTVEVPPTPPTPPVVPPTPPVVPPTPPVVPPTPPVVPPTDPSEPPAENIIIIDDDTPLAAEVAQVLGAKRETPAVLGARRARTGDMAQDPLYAALMIMGASATALSLLGAEKKRR